MPSLRDKLRATQPRVQPAAPPKPAPVDCLVVETRLDAPRSALSLPPGILPLMQGAGMPGDVAPQNLLFMDTETTGLSHGAGTIAFLVGTGTLREGQLVIRQYLMRDYDEEIFVLRRVMADLDACQALVTFNGRSFDMPLLASRFIMQRIRADYAALPHADLLHTARRVWKMRLRGCSLSALEEKVYGKPRVDDLPGALVPQRYFDYLKCKDMALLADVLRHNAQDIATLAQLLYTLADLHARPLDAGFDQDIYSLGRVMEKRGRVQDARMCYRALDESSVNALSRKRLADSLRRGRSYDEAAVIYERMIAARQGGAAPYIALSKLCEHRLGDPARALDIARRGLTMLSGATLRGDRDQQALEDLTRRCHRLMRKCASAKG